MLQPLQLKDVSLRYAEEIAELRDFLRKAGLPLDTPETLSDLAARLQDDRAFRRDLISHIWVISHAGQFTLGLPDTLGVLAVAAAGQRLAADADDAEAHSLLRFLMEARRSFDTASEAKKVVPIRTAEPTALQPVEPLHPVPVPVSAVRPELFTRHTSSDGYATEDQEQQETPDRRPLIWGAAVACLLIACLVALWMRHAPATPNALADNTTPPPIAAVSADTASAPSPAASSTTAASTPHASAATRKPSPITSSYSEALTPAPRTSATPKPSAGTPAPAPAAHGPSRPASTHRDTAATNANPPHLARRRTPPPAPAAGDLSALVPRVQPVIIAPETDDTGTNTSYRPRNPIVRPTSLGIMAANVTYSPAPTYPPQASAAHVQGEVKVEAEVDPEGNVSSARVISGPPLLREAAVNAVEHWRYRPYVADGKPITMSALIVMDFQLP